jgi:protochlorophyllide reductase
MQFGTNVIGHFAFTDTIIPLLIKTAKIAPAGTVRMVWVSSSAVCATIGRDEG